MKRVLLFFPVVDILLFTTVFANIIHIPADSLTIQAGINGAVVGDTVLVAPSIYYENINFLGKEILLASHYIFDNDTTTIESTIIDGSNPTNPDSASVVLFISGEDTNSVLKGFTIMNGGGIIDTFYYNAKGGGIYCYNSSPVISHNIIKNNGTTDFLLFVYGGGIYCYNSQAVIKNNIIRDNVAGGAGGICASISSPIISNNIISNNTAIGSWWGSGLGGGIIFSYSSPKIVNNTIINNEASGEVGGLGGGIYGYRASAALIANNIITNNNSYGWFYGAGADGGGVYIVVDSMSVFRNNVVTNNWSSGPWNGRGGGIFCRGPIIILNNTICNNTAYNGDYPGVGGGIYCSNSEPLIVNCILWANTAEVDSQIYWSDGAIQVTFSDIQGVWEGQGNINVDPLFVGGDPFDYNLQEGSPCVDAGTDTIITALGDTIIINDYSGNSPDMGALESPYIVMVKDLIIDLIPSHYFLSQNYPNPFNSTTYINYGLSKASKVTIKLYNILGQKIETLIDEYRAAGTYRILWDASAYPSGVYFCQIHVDGYNLTKKMCLLK